MSILRHICAESIDFGLQACSVYAHLEEPTRWLIKTIGLKLLWN